MRSYPRGAPVPSESGERSSKPAEGHGKEQVPMHDNKMIIGVERWRYSSLTMIAQAFSVSRTRRLRCSCILHSINILREAMVVDYKKHSPE